jgi:hypothetical protein
MAPSFTGDAAPDTSVPARRRTDVPAFDPAGSWRGGVFAGEILGGRTISAILRGGFGSRRVPFAEVTVTPGAILGDW